MSLEFINEANNLIQKTMNLNDEIISQEALEYIKLNKNKLVNLFLVQQNTSKKMYCLAGSPGAGKSEIAQTISNAKNIDIIEADEIRKICPHYNGKNSNLFQKASSKGVNILVDTAFKKEYSFILDGNFSELRLQEENISRATKKNYDIEIYFIYRPLEIALEYTQIREEKEGRNIPKNIFYRKFIDSIKTVNSIVKTYANVKVTFYDLNKKTYEVINSLDDIIKKDLSFKNDIIKAELILEDIKKKNIKDKILPLRPNIKTNYQPRNKIKTNNKDIER